MNTERQRHAEAAILAFQKRFMAKQEKGQNEHGGDIWRKPVLEHMAEEILDQWAYYFVLAEHLKQIKQISRGALDYRGDSGEVRYQALAKIFNIVTYGNPEGDLTQGG